MNDNPYIPLPPDAPWDPSSFFLDEGSRIAAQLFGRLLTTAPDSVAEYLLFRTGASLIWTSDADREFIRQACEVYSGLFDLGMNRDGDKLMKAHVIVGRDYQGTHETVVAADKASNVAGLTDVQRAEGLLSYYARLFESWKLLAAVPAFAKEIYAGTAGARLPAADYVSHDRDRISILSLAAVLPNVAPHPINLLIRGANRHIRNATDHQAGIQVRGRNPARFILRDRRWTAVMTLDEISAAVSQIKVTVDALQAGLLITRINYPEAYAQEVGKLGEGEERHDAQFIEMAAAHHGFEASDVTISKGELKVSLRLLPGAHSYEETEVKQYRRRGGRVSVSVRVRPAFVWSTNEQVANVVSMIAVIVRGRRLELAVQDRQGEDLGQLHVPAALTERLGQEGFTVQELLQSGDNRLADRAPFDVETDSLQAEAPPDS